MNQYKSGLNLHRVQPTLIVRQRDSFEKLTRTSNFSTRCFFSHTVFCLTQFFVSHGFLSHTDRDGLIMTSLLSVGKTSFLALTGEGLVKEGSGLHRTTEIIESHSECPQNGERATPWYGPGKHEKSCLDAARRLLRSIKPLSDCFAATSPHCYAAGKGIVFYVLIYLNPGKPSVVVPPPSASRGD